MFYPENGVGRGSNLKNRIMADFFGEKIHSFAECSIFYFIRLYQKLIRFFRIQMLFQGLFKPGHSKADVAV